ncbi:MAG: hypothetical protein ACK5YW_08585 [Betaproteobacteria bacterium]|nr:hypothetical protein [Rhodocyclaceae bacterium]MCA3133522.1 hypothetical protein [Rhodocyclaceae bacterium]MCA3141456.1 hypothetical protein [Rhodocyclaceae bacterium]MCA3145787.1 hypothetical protein [Rhodocyclaceae bacterium]MCE2897943.1 hypothetical protein [Betaproteobacteria bacterium]
MLVLFAGNVAGGDAGDGRQLRRALAPAQPAVAVTGESGNQRLEFDFGRDRGSAWVARKGELYVEAWVQHRGLLCATYEVGVRFGEGRPGCADVRWLAPPRWVTSLRQCNNAVVKHAGNDTDAELPAVFERITCAERLIECVSGSC